MKNTWFIFKREMMAFFFSPIAYIVALGVLGFNGGSFNFIVRILSEESGTPYTPSDWFFNGIFTWIILLVVPPILTMRLFAEEKKTGIIEGIMTAPIRDLEYVLGKYLSAVAFFIILWLPTASYVFILRAFAKDTTPLDLGPLMGGYLGIALIGLLLIGVGCVASAMTRNQIVGAVISFTAGALLFFTGIYFFLDAAGSNRGFFESISMMAHTQEFARGVVDWKRVIFYISGAAYCLFLTHQVVQSRHWST